MPLSESSVTSRRAFLTQGTAYTLAGLSPVISGFVITPVLTRLLGGHEYGGVATGFVVSQAFSFLAALGVPAAVTRHVSIERSGEPGARSLVVIQSTVATGLTLLVIAASPYWHRAFSGLSTAAAVGAAVSGGALAVLALVQAYWRGAGRPVPYVAAALAVTVGGGCLGGAALLLQRSAGAYLLGLSVGYAVIAAVCLRSVGSGARGRDKAEFFLALRIGLPTITHQVATYLATGALILVVGRRMTPDAAGQLQLTLLVGSAPALLLTSVNNAWAPLVYRTNMSARADVLSGTGRLVMWLMAYCAVGVSLLAPLALTLVAPASYRPLALAPAAGIVSAVGLIVTLYLANVHLIFASGRTRALAAISPLCLAVSCCLAYLAAGAQSFVGLAASYLMFFLLQFVAVAAVRRRVAPEVSWRESTLSGPLAVGLSVTVLLYLVGDWLPGSPMRLVFALVVGLVAVYHLLRLARDERSTVAAERSS